jgi:hypothetical protein
MDEYVRMEHNSVAKQIRYLEALAGMERAGDLVVDTPRGRVVVMEA